MLAKWFYNFFKVKKIIKVFFIYPVFSILVYSFIDLLVSSPKLLKFFSSTQKYIFLYKRLLFLSFFGIIDTQGKNHKGCTSVYKLKECLKRSEYQPQFLNDCGFYSAL